MLLTPGNEFLKKSLQILSFTVNDHDHDRGLNLAVQFSQNLSFGLITRAGSRTVQIWPRKFFKLHRKTGWVDALFLV